MRIAQIILESVPYLTGFLFIGGGALILWVRK
jgi:hypothetical protein